MKRLSLLSLGLLFAATFSLQGCGGSDGVKPSPSERSHMEQQREREAYDELDEAVGN